MIDTCSPKGLAPHPQILPAKRSPGVRYGIMLFICLILITTGTLWPAEATTPDPDIALNDLLVQARRSVEVFWRQFESVNCTESLTQQKLGKGGTPEYQQKSTSDYLVLLTHPESNFSVEESRLQQGKESKPKNIPLLLTNGLPTLLLIFHPHYAENFLFQLDGDENVAGHKIERIQFKYVPGRQSTTAFRIRDREYPLSLEGVAWIDSQTGAIQKIAASLAAPMKDLNLKALRMEVSYLPQKFSSTDESFWLPSIATVNIQSERQQWRNVYQYSKCRLFNVQTKETIAKTTE